MSRLHPIRIEIAKIKPWINMNYRNDHNAHVNEWRRVTHNEIKLRALVEKGVEAGAGRLACTGASTGVEMTARA